LLTIGASDPDPPAPAEDEGSDERPTKSSGELRVSSLFRVSSDLIKRGGANMSAVTVTAPLRRRGLRRRLTAALVVAALGPVIAVSVVAVALIFSSVEQGIQFEAVRGLQVARGLFLQQVQEVAAGAGRLGDDLPLRETLVMLGKLSGRIGHIVRIHAGADLAEIGVVARLHLTDAVVSWVKRH